MNSPLRRPGIRPPQPVDPGSQQWLAMFYQWVIDTLTHLDECMDRTQSAHEETRAELTAWMTAAATADSDFASKLAEHISEHTGIDNLRRAKKSVWVFQWDTIKEIGKIAGSGTAIGAALYLLNHL